MIELIELIVGQPYKISKDPTITLSPGILIDDGYLYITGVGFTARWQVKAAATTMDRNDLPHSLFEKLEQQALTQEKRVKQYKPLRMTYNDIKNHTDLIVWRKNHIRQIYYNLLKILENNPIPDMFINEWLAAESLFDVNYWDITQITKEVYQQWYAECVDWNLIDFKKLNM